jgi:CheY-like chemotaxis protein
VILFEVKDTGIGISKDVRERLFQPFTQGDTSMTRLFGGTGLGLAISKKLVEIMGGRIWLESEPGVGSTFSFTITVDGAGELQQQREKEVPSRPIHMVAAKKGKLRLLLAEDNQTNQKVILRMLKKIGYTADVAANGKEVLEALSIRTYDLILMDIQMPEMDGLEASRIIRSKREKRASPWIIAITAYAMNGDRERCIKAGMDNYISKPVQMDELKSVLHIYEDKLIEGDGGGSNCAWCDEE